MPAWTNLHPVTVGRIKEGSRTPLFNNTQFEVVSHEDGKTTLRCIKTNPEEGYGEGALVQLDSEERIIYDSNREAS